jgi:mannosylglycerate hydrolase MGH1-like protein/glycosyl hydrolase family 65
MRTIWARTVVALSIVFTCLFLWPPCGLSEDEQAREPVRLLQPGSFQKYFSRFAQQERAFLGAAPTVPWPWFVRNIPWLDVPDKDLEEMYYFRWYSFQKHIHQTPYGFVIDEFLDDVPWAGKYNAINAAAQHHLREARWLRDQNYAEKYARFWFSPAGEPRRYSFAAADSVYSVYLANNDRSLAINLLPALVGNYETWEKTHRDSNGLFWQIDDRDGMEDSIGGSGYRPSINSYMYGDAIAISKIAKMAGNVALSDQYRAKAEELRAAVETRLWNPGDEFYETIPRKPDAKWVGVRELVGYVPWYFDLPEPDRAIAWKQLTDPRGFAGTYGPTTAERRSPRYRFYDAHECLWNGPSWPFATTQTLVGVANLLNGPPQSIIGTDQYWELFRTYVRSQHIELPNGQRIPWIDEDLDPDTGEWIARNILESRKQPPANRGRYYNHSGFADLVVTGLFGIRPSDGNVLEIHPLLAPSKWTYFAVDGLPYHGHLLTVLYDRDGTRYHRGKGLQVLCDGVRVGSEPNLAPFSVRLPED